MRSRWRVILVFGLTVAIPSVLAAQSTKPGAAVPKYNTATESVFKGVVQEVRDRECPVSGGLGSHLILKLDDGPKIEVHLASSKFVKTYDLTFKVGDRIEVTGSKVQFEGVDTIFAREVKRGDDVFVFRDNEGKPVW
jgi:hypothetical protein